MEAYRPVLEVLKLASPSDILAHASVTSRTWNRITESSELWSCISDELRFKEPGPNSKAEYMREFNASFCLAATWRGCVKVYNCLTEKWRELPLSLDAQFNLTSACTWLPTGELFVCGSYQPLSPDAAVIDAETGAISLLSPMQTARGHHAIVYHDSFIYVFSGYQKKVTRKCEKFNLASKVWTHLPDIPDGLANSSPCLENSNVYLCCTEFCGLYTFDTRVDTFTSLNIKVKTQGLVKCCFMVEDELVVLSAEVLSRWKVGSSEPLRTQRVKAIHSGWWGSMKPLVVRDVLHLLSENGNLLTLHLQTLTTDSTPYLMQENTS